MKKLFGGTTRTRFIAAASAFTCLVALVTSASAAQLEEARVTQVVSDVKLLPQQAAPRPAAVNDPVRPGTAVRTGTESRSELTFTDLTITRLGANTIFSFNQGTREMNLINGAILFQVPKGSGGATIKTAAVTAAITGTTGIGEFHPVKTRNALPFSKWLGLEGTFRLILPNGQSLEVGPGKMVTTDGKSFSKVQSFNIGQVMKTALLVIGYDTSLPSQVLALIALEEQKQLASGFVDTTTQNFLDLARIIDVVSQANATIETSSPSIPSEFGAPSVISSPVPYLITSSTVITTDPTITTNGVTDFGTIYRGPAQDGPFSVFLFGSTSAFDLALKYDVEFFADPNNLPIAVFKFQSLSLIGNPIINLGTGGITKLGLVGVDGITSGPPGGTLTFSGLDGLLLATQAGSINLTSDVSFQNIDTFVAYARGAGSNLTLASPILNSNVVVLAAEGSMHLELGITVADRFAFQTGGDLISTGSGKFTVDNKGGTIGDGGRIRFKIGGNLSSQDLSLLIENTAGGHINTGGNITVTTGGNLKATGDATFTIDNTNGTINNGGNITFTTGGSVSTAGEFSLLVENYDETAHPAGHIGTGGNISLTTGGNLTADFASIAINNRGGGRIDSGVSLTIDIAGAVTTMENGPDFLGNTASLSIAISTRYDDTAGNTTKSFIGGDAALNFHADSASIGGNLSVFLSDRGGTIDGNALLNFNVTHNVTVTGTDIPNISDAADIELLNDSGTPGGAESPFGGTIHGNATLQVSAANLTLTATAGSLFVAIDNRNGGLIDSNATLTFNLAANLTTQGSAEFDILNDQNQNSNGMPGGSIGLAATLDIKAANISIGSDFTARILNHRAQGAPGPGAGSIGTNATLNITAGSFAVGGGLDVAIFNRDAGIGSGTGGSIGGNAAINLDLTGNLSTQGDAEVIILNESVVAGSPGGTIGGNAAINVTAANISTGGSLFAEIDNFTGGNIGGNANLDFSLTGDLTTSGNADFTINNSNGSAPNGGTIGSNATTNVTAQNVTADALFASIINYGGNIGGNAVINVGASGDINAPGGASFQIINDQNNDGDGPGTIGSDAIIGVSAGNLTAGSLSAQILNQDGGMIGSSANIDFNVSGDATVTNDTTIEVLGSDGAAGAAININGGNYDSGGTFLAYIDGNGTITFNNASVHADVLKVGAFGPNGVLKIGGGTLSADTTLKLYAPGSNGQLNFVSNVTLGGNSMKILAANSVTIFNSVVVTIGGTYPADVYTNNANYSEAYGGNDSTTGTFAGAGANSPQPLSSAPPFNDTFSPTTATTSTKVTSSSRISDSNLKTTSGKKTGSEINVSSSEQLLAMLDGAAAGPGGKITIPGSKIASNWRDSSGVNAAGRLNAGRRAADIRDAHSLPARRFVP